ncbi:hypothetical protein AXG93_2175s1580 [Marchantia polymorpha subsp. ruderalis]|uniref:non-specific serine/threonine protein kinase n=1 Tax=Marchantia polymorpha subsp. ruderalis TaxID=1480154 RepID=A0A176W6F8_MARPO|nr:hypothetical protein AXG93_2175s1580 [Marchantia polymorpha subsp. ruderalis]
MGSSTLRSREKCRNSRVDANFTMGTMDSPFDCSEDGNLWCEGTASTEDGNLVLTDFQESQGLVLRRDPIILLQNGTGRWDSFRTSFRFTMKPGGDGISTFNGDGMALVMLNVSQYDRRMGGSFVVYGNENVPQVKTLAVEFDTYWNAEDEDDGDNHVGVDTDSRISKVARDASEVNVELLGNRTLFAWVDFDSPTNMLEVRLSYNYSKPGRALLSYEANLSDIFGRDPEVYFGFSASNGLPVGGQHSVMEWKFESFPAKFGDLELNETPASAPAESSGNWKKVALNASLGTLGAVVLLSILVFLVWKRIRRSTPESADSGTRALAPAAILLEDTSATVRYTYDQLKKATLHFSDRNKLGQGGFGSVYKGLLPTTGQMVAVKKVSKASRQGDREFAAEVSIISHLRHRNIVRLLGWCRHRAQLLLVYEYMPNGSLDKALFEPTQESVLSWNVRFQIITGAAEALCYLHEGSRQKVIHRDFKPSNILLDEDYNAMLGDFGLARMVDRHKSLATTLLAGTYGYIAPETPSTGKFTQKTDVFAFGAVALEVACGKVAYSAQRPHEERLLVDCVWRAFTDGRLMSVVDPRLAGNYDPEKMETLLLLGLLCSHRSPEERPSMRRVVEILAGSVQLPPIPTSIYVYNEHSQFRFKSVAYSSSLSSMWDSHSDSFKRDADSTSFSFSHSFSRSIPSTGHSGYDLHVQGSGRALAQSAVEEAA